MLAYGEEEGWERRPRGDLAVEEWRGVAEGKGRAGSGEEGAGAGDEEQEERRGGSSGEEEEQRKRIRQGQEGMSGEDATEC